MHPGLKNVGQIDAGFLAPANDMTLTETDVLLGKWSRAWKEGRVELELVEEMAMVDLRLSRARYGVDTKRSKVDRKTGVSRY